jgi:hypothetical protein
VQTARIYIQEGFDVPTITILCPTAPTLIDTLGYQLVQTRGVKGGPPG